MTPRVAGNRPKVKHAEIDPATRRFIALQCVVMAIRPGTKIPLEKWAWLPWRDPDTVRRDWRRFGPVASGVATGPSHLVVIDLDGPEGQHNWRELTRDVPRTASSTMRLETPNGVQGYYWCPDGVRFKTCAGQLAPGVDVRAWGGMVKVYDPTEPGRQLFGTREPAPLPPWLSDMLPLAGDRAERPGTAPRTGDALAPRLLAASGSQHDALLGVMLEAQRRYGDETAVAVVYELAQMLPLLRRREPWTLRDIRGLVKPGVIPDATEDEAELLAQPIAIGRRSR